MRTETISFIEKYIDLIDENNFELLYKNIIVRDPDSSQVGDITQVLLDSGINPLEYLKVHIPFGMYSDISGIVSFEVPERIISIGSCAFRKCQDLKEFKFNKNSKKCKHNLFSECFLLQKVDMKDSQISNIEFNTFLDDNNLREVFLPRNLKAIEANAFKNCTSLKTISFPKTLKSIDAYAFLGCTNLKDIIFEGTIQEWESVFCNKRIFVGVPTKIITCIDGITKLRR